jgi:hypothetical protein
MAMIAMGLMGAFQAYSSIQSARAQEEMYNAQARDYEAQSKIALNNKAMAENQASETLAEGAREERRFRLRALQEQAAQEAGFAASGAAISGSPLLAMADTAQGIEEDAAMIRFNTLKQKWGFDVEGVNYLNQSGAALQSAANARASAKNARRAGTIGAVGSLLGAGLNIWGAASGPINATASGNTIKVGSSGGGMNYPGFGVPPISGASYGSMYYNAVTGNSPVMSDAAYRRMRSAWMR